MRLRFMGRQGVSWTCRVICCYEAANVRKARGELLYPKTPAPGWPKPVSQGESSAQSCQLLRMGCMDSSGTFSSERTAISVSSAPAGLTACLMRGELRGEGRLSAFGVPYGDVCFTPAAVICEQDTWWPVAGVM